MNGLKEYLKKEAEFIGEETISGKTLLKLIQGFKEDCLHGDFKIINGVFQCTRCGKPYMETGQLDVLKFISDCREKVDAEVPFGKEDAYDDIINEIDKNLKQSIQVGDITEKGIVDTVGNCANCGVEFHIHKEVFEKDELLSNLMFKATKLSEIDSYNRKMVRLDKLQELLTNEILK